MIDTLNKSSDRVKYCRLISVAAYICVAAWLTKIDEMTAMRIQKFFPNVPFVYEKIVRWLQGPINSYHSF